MYKISWFFAGDWLLGGLKGGNQLKKYAKNITVKSKYYNICRTRAKGELKIHSEEPVMDMNHHIDAHIQSSSNEDTIFYGDQSFTLVTTKVLHWLHKHNLYNIVQKNHEWKCV